MSGHTPGPWEWSVDRLRDGYSGLFSGNDPVIYPQRQNDGDDGAAWFGTDEYYYGETALNPADANLIAASPELLEACEMAVQTFIVSCRPAGNPDVDDAAEISGMVATLRAAIAKATGEQHDPR